MKEIGTVISSLEGPTSSEFSFVIKNATSEIPIRKNQFIQLNTEEGLLIARVSEVMKTNRYFMRPEAVSEYEKSGKPLMELFPVDKWEYLVANAVSIGIYSEKSQKRVSYPPSPGQKVFQVEEKILADFLGLDQIKGLEIGKVHFHNLPMKINLTKLFQKHAAILSQTGFGKSHLVSVLIEEILSRPEEHGKPALIVIDPHGEYSSFSDDPSFMSRTKVFNSKNISLNTSTLSARQISEFQPFITSVERRELSKVIEKLRKEKSSFDMEMVVNEIENSDINPRSKTPLISWLEELNTSKLFKNYDSPNVDEFVKSGQLSILDLSDFIHLRERQIIATYFARRIFNARRSEKICPAIIFVEEAHQFAPQQEEAYQAISKNIIETIAREGRKFNCCLVLISQRPIQLSTTALSQCNSQIILRVSNPYDIDHIGRSCEGVTQDILKMLPGLKVGEALIAGEVVHHPLLVQINDRKSKKSEKGKSLEESIIFFNNEKEISKKDLEAFT